MLTRSRSALGPVIAGFLQSFLLVRPGFRPLLSKTEALDMSKEIGLMWTEKCAVRSWWRLDIWEDPSEYTKGQRAGYTHFNLYVI